MNAKANNITVDCTAGRGAAQRNDPAVSLQGEEPDIFAQVLMSGAGVRCVHARRVGLGFRGRNERHV